MIHFQIGQDINSFFTHIKFVFQKCNLNCKSVLAVLTNLTCKFQA